MSFVAREYMLGETGGALAVMLYNSCSVTLPDDEGYCEFLFDLHCKDFKIIAKFVGSDDNILFDVKDVELID